MLMQFCFLRVVKAAFKEIVDKMAPRDWHTECNSNLDMEGLPEVVPVEG